MLFKRYRVRIIDQMVRQRLAASGKPTEWVITANDLPGAWRKFVCRNFGALKPNPYDYDVSFHSAQRTKA